MARENDSVEGTVPAGEPEKEKKFFDKYGAHLFLGALVFYVVLLGIGTIAEIFKIQSILDWWIWRTW